MRITDYQNVHGVKDVNHGAAKTSRVNKTHEDEFEQELADCINKRKSKKKNEKKKRHSTRTSGSFWVKVRS
ncbi:MAG: hypothetical protein CM1200mP16_09060 [Nitrospina sp.]|nr:MAG: hypothetical protein CM1200mP16_09060 [Nitrospina sp.]